VKTRHSDDLQDIFGATDYPSRCCGDPDAADTSGLVAYVDGEPAGWVAVEPRTEYPGLRTSRVPWSGRDEDNDDDRTWAVTCFVVRRSSRGRAR
jgi:hypothetical protein